MTHFYNQKSNDYFKATVDADMTSVQEKFLAYIPKGGSILDAGCWMLDVDRDGIRSLS
jgi:hypothetical protein